MSATRLLWGTKDLIQGPNAIKIDRVMECAPRTGQDYAAILTRLPGSRRMRGGVARRKL